MKHSFLYVLEFSAPRAPPWSQQRSLLQPCPASSGPSHTPVSGSVQVLSARQSHGAVAGASPVAEAATSTGEVLDVGAGTVKRAQGKLELTQQRILGWFVLKGTLKTISLLSLPWEGTPSTRPGCSKLYPAEPWTLPGMGRTQLPWATSGRASPHSQGGGESWEVASGAKASSQTCGRTRRSQNCVLCFNLPLQPRGT